MKYCPRSLLITGGAGFIGSNFIRYLLRRDEDVRIVNLDKLTYAGSPVNLANLPAASRHIFIQGDICDRELVDKLLSDHAIDTIVHFAAESHVDRSIVSPAAFVETNVVGTFILLDAARQYWLGEKGYSERDCRFHHISTDEVYGMLQADDPAFTETTPYMPNSPYSASKAGADHLVRSYCCTYGLPVVTTNCSNNYGPYQHSEKFIPTVIRSCMELKPIPVYGDGTNIRDWLYVDDHCRGIDIALRNGASGETYNIGGGNEWTNIDIVRLICELMDKKMPQNSPHGKLITFVTDRPGHDWRYAMNAGKIMSKLNWKPKETFATGIRKTLDWYLATRVKRKSTPVSHID
jgi:dTDP-glucose 4,6-dehydratase